MSQPHADTKTNVVDLWYTRCGAGTASALAIRKNWLQEEFAGEGTRLHSLRESDSVELRNSHFHHKQSGMFREGGNIPPIWTRGNGQDTVVLGITWLDEYQGVLTLKSSNIRTPADLKGKRLGIPLTHDAVIDFQRAAGQHGFVTALAQAGLKAEDATFVDIDVRRTGDGVDPITAALDSGAVDAIFYRFASGYRISKNPAYHEVININTLADPLLRVNNGTPRPVTVDRPFLEKNPDVVVRYLTVLLRTGEWAAAHREEVARLLISESGGDTVDDIYAAHGENAHLSFTPKLTPEYLAGLETQKNFLRDWGYVKHDFRVEDWIVTEPLAAARKKLDEERSQRGSAAA